MTEHERASLERHLREAVRGEVRFDLMTRGLYATDASLYQQFPVALVVPRDEADLIAAVAVAAEHGVPILPRGGGTSLAGQCVGETLVLDCSKHLNALLEVNVEERWARVQPGLVRDELNALVAPHGLHLAVDPATGNRAAVGGMIANNTSGTRSIRYGMMIAHLLAARVLLSDGTVLDLSELDQQEYARRAAAPGREGEVLTGFRRIIETHRQAIVERYPKILRRAQGYMLDEFIGGGPWNLAKLMCGSEGTLATLLEARVNLEPIPAATGLVVVHFADRMAAIEAVEPILAHDPAAVELVDDQILAPARRNLQTARLCGFLDGEPAAILVVELAVDDLDRVAERANRLVSELRAGGVGYAWPVLLDKSRQAEVWALRKAGLGLMLGRRGDAKPLAFIEDAAVPVPRLSEYIRQIVDYCAALETEVALYAHASVGLLHVRPIVDLKQPAGVEKMKAIAAHSVEVVLSHGGSISGEHGDGRVRSPFLERYFGPEVYAAFGEVKALFDPAGLMNPGKIVAPPPMDQDLRYPPGYRVSPLATHYHYRADGGFAGAVEMCNGVGACRKTLTGTMCPSYIATRDEEHSTRGRANALRLAMSGQLGDDGLASDRLHEVLDLCLACKGCKAECPSNVDLARLKSEVLQLRHDRYGVPLRDKLIGAAPELAARLSGPAAGLVNRVNASRPMRRLLERLVGLDARRTPPAYARERFGAWLAGRAGRSAPDRRVVLFDDTYLNYHEPHLGRTAVELLEACGYEVLVARAGCCQRPRISRGLLREAKRRGEQTLRRLDPFFAQGLPVLVCEPSCAAALGDDLPDLIDDEALGERAKRGVRMIDEFLAAELAAGRLAVGLEPVASEILIHGHCHQKALYGTGAMTRLLSAAGTATVREIDSGCCGMAGGFGYEHEHYDLSVKVGEDRLLPALRAASSATIVACGFSCRHQIADLTGRRALHLIEALRPGPARGS